MSRRGKPLRQTFECPHCGADVAVGAVVCRECGSDADTGWQDEDEINYQGTDLPTGYSRDDDHPGDIVSGRRPVWIVVTALVVAAALVYVTLRFFRW